MMSSNSIQPEPPTAVPPPALEHVWTGLFCLFLALAMSGGDILWPSLNASILYPIPLMLYVLLTRQKAPRWLMVALCALALGMYLCKPLPENIPPGILRLYHYRIVNRLLVMVVIVGIGMLSARLAYLRGIWEQSFFGLPMVEMREDYRSQIHAFLSAVGALGLIVVIFIVDLLTAANINLAILYVLLPLLAVWSGSRRLLWYLVPLVMLLPFGDCAWDRYVRHTEIPDFVLLNRALTSLIGTLTTVGLCVGLRYQSRRSLHTPADASPP